MRNVAGFSLTLASIFLAVVAVLIQAPSLFYMGTALFATIGGSNLQAWLAVRGLRFERIAPSSVRIGDLVTIEIAIWSERRIRRPLISVLDKLPGRLRVQSLTPSLPVAPAFDTPIVTQYQFRALRRGRYRWSGLTVSGTDALGLVTKKKDYDTETTEITIVPRPIPVSIELPVAAGWGISEAESGQTRGAGIEPRGIREYSHGDSLRHVHWRSTARTGRLLVKEFEAGTHAAAAFLFQRTRGTDLASDSIGSLDMMCGHVLFLADMFIQQGARVELPGLDNAASHLLPTERIREISELLATIADDSGSTVTDELARTDGQLPPGSVVFVLLTVADPNLAGLLPRLAVRGTTIVPLLYDAKFFDPKFTGISATDPDFIAGLRAGGASPFVMPTDGGDYA
jgi:uncharacterized protein (DUF58 family)